MHSAFVVDLFFSQRWLWEPRDSKEKLAKIPVGSQGFWQYSDLTILCTDTILTDIVLLYFTIFILFWHEFPQAPRFRALQSVSQDIDFTGDTCTPENFPKCRFCFLCLQFAIGNVFSSPQAVTAQNLWKGEVTHVEKLIPFNSVSATELLTWMLSDDWSPIRKFNNQTN